MSEPLLTVVCITYNHAAFIRQALEGFVMQKTDFKFQVIVSDDCSTDGNQNIIREFQQKYPELIKPVFHEKNIGVAANLFTTFAMAKSRYVAMCEGDDYWTDPQKLQKQVDFLEANPDFSACSHFVTEKWENHEHPDRIAPNIRERRYNTILTRKDILNGCVPPTQSLVYRWKFANEDIMKYYTDKECIIIDWLLALLHSENGKLKYLPEVMAVYRRHGGGVFFGGAEAGDEYLLKSGIKYLKSLKSFEDYLGEEKSVLIRCRRRIITRKTINILLKHCRFDDLKKISSELPEYYQDYINSHQSPLSDRLFYLYHSLRPHLGIQTRNILHILKLIR
ncbi:MAG: glycosyltransferase [Lentisphaerae bacterium]|nr:glycosyltransferase [Lentisphaerota bacterium]